MNAWHYIAQLTAENSKALLTYGPLGIFCAWLMFRAERMGSQVLSEIRGLSHRINGITKAMLIDILSRDNTGDNPKAKSLAQEMLRESEARDNKD